MGSGASKPTVDSVPPPDIRGDTGTTTNNEDTGTNKNGTNPAPQKQTKGESTPSPKSGSQTKGSGRKTESIFKPKVVEGMKKLKKRLSTSQIVPKDVTKKSNDPVILGDMSVKIPITAKVVRIFTSSTFTDSREERNFWMKYAYPVLSEHCKKQGYEFQVVDMRWGIRDDASDDHSTTELCLKELKLCQQLSTGPNFISLVSHKYGSHPLSRTIATEDFDQICKAITDEKQLKLLTKWYTKDENSVPPEYVLSRISRYIPEYKPSERKGKASDEWWDTSQSLEQILWDTAKEVLKPEAISRYFVSVTEVETRKGMLEVKNQGESCLWYKRTITDIEKQVKRAKKINPEEDNEEGQRLKKKELSTLNRFIECQGPKVKVDWANKMMKDMKEKMSKHLPENNIREHAIKWKNSEGVDRHDDEHAVYLESMKEDFIEQMQHMIDASIKKRSEKENNHPLYTECLQHLRFAQNKCHQFEGRSSSLQDIKDYLLSNSSSVFVIHGPSGCGKTSLMAKTAQNLRTWMKDGEPSLCLRFIGTTPDSSHISTLLISLITQIRVLYDIEDDIPETFSDITKETEDILEHATRSRPLVILLDSLDQLDDAYNAKSMFWLPMVLPPYVKIVVSVLDEEENNEVYNNLQNIMLKQMFLGGQNFLSVPKMDQSEVESIIDHWFQLRKRALTTDQREILFTAYEKCPLPLFLKLSFDEACKWQSHWPTSETVLQKTVIDSIQHLFLEMEKKHGEIFVKKALGYLTVSRNGLSQSELEDILSCDDDVLKDIYQYSVPPIIRLPPLLLVRLRNDLQEYITERGADGVSVMAWYHRQFYETAHSMYVPDKPTKRELHKQLAEYFSGKWHGVKKKFYDAKKKEEKQRDRQVAAQPLLNGDKYNLRKLNNLPYHWTGARDKDMLLKECLLNLKFLQTKIRATSVRHVLDDYSLALQKWTKSKKLKTLYSAFELSQDALIYDPGQLVPQMLDRLRDENDLSQFGEQCKTVSSPYLLPDRPIQMKPGGQLVHCMSGHHGPIESLDVKEDGSLAVTCADDGEDTVKAWGVKDGILLKSYNGVGRNPTRVRFVNNDSLILVNYSGSLIAIKEKGERAYSIPHTYGIDVITGKGKSVLCVFTKSQCFLYDIRNGEQIHDLEYPSEDFLFYEESSSCVAASQRYVILTHSKKHAITQFHVETHEFTEWSEIFPLGSENSVDTVAITPDENLVIISNVGDNDLHIYDRQTMSKLETVKGVPTDFAANYKISPDSKVLYFANGTNIVTWDLKTKKRSTILTHPRDITSCVRISHKVMVTASEDEMVRVWDLERTDKTSGTDSRALGYNIRYFDTLPNPDFCVLLTQKKKSDVTCSYLGVYQISTKVLVRQTKLQSVPGILKVIGEKEVVINADTLKLKVVDLDQMRVVRVFDGYISYFTKDVKIIPSTRELITHTKGRMAFKVVDIDTGKTKAVLQRPENVRINSRFKSDFHVNVNGTRLAGKYKDGPWVVYDLEKREFMRIIDLRVDSVSAREGLLSEDGTKFCCCFKSQMVSPGKSLDLYHMKSFAIYEIQEGVKLKECVDSDQQKIYFEKENKRGLDIALDDLYRLDTNRVISTHDDFILRVWNIDTGNLERKLMGHKSATKLFGMDNSAYFGSFEEENNIRIWDRMTLNCIASFSLDINVVKNEFCSDGFHFVSSTKSPNASLIHWTLHGLLEEPTTTKHPPCFVDYKSLDMVLDLSSDDDYNKDTNDPDEDTSEDDADESDDEFEQFSGLIM